VSRKGNSYSPAHAAKAALGRHGFIPHTRELLMSDAWRGRSIHAARVLEFFELEHLKHGGKENGLLKGTRRQLTEFGVSAQFVKGAIEENIKRGLLEVTCRGGYAGGARQTPSLYRITYLAWKLERPNARPEWIPPTNEWLKFQKLSIAEIPTPKRLPPSRYGRPRLVFVNLEKGARH
jgi:hypothetical protein